MLGTYGDETRRAVVRDVDESGEKIVVEFSPTPRSASQVSSMFARDVSLVSRPAKPHALAHLLPPKLGDALGRTVNLEDAFRDAEAIGIYRGPSETVGRGHGAAREFAAVGRREKSSASRSTSSASQMPGDVDMTLKAKGGHRVLLGDDPNILVVDSPETVVTNWNRPFGSLFSAPIAALVVVSPSAEVHARRRRGFVFYCRVSVEGPPVSANKAVGVQAQGDPRLLARRRRLIGAAGRLPRALFRALGAGRPASRRRRWARRAYDAPAGPASALRARALVRGARLTPRHHSSVRRRRRVHAEAAC